MTHVSLKHLILGWWIPFKPCPGCELDAYSPSHVVNYGKFIGFDPSPTWVSLKMMGELGNPIEHHVHYWHGHQYPIFRRTNLSIWASRCIWKWGRENDPLTSLNGQQDHPNTESFSTSWVCDEMMIDHCDHEQKKWMIWNLVIVYNLLGISHLHIWLKGRGANKYV